MAYFRTPDRNSGMVINRYTPDPLHPEKHTETCRCGGKKKRHAPFCGKCVTRLSDEMLIDLAEAPGQGYEEAYMRALRFLTSQNNTNKDVRTEAQKKIDAVDENVFAGLPAEFQEAILANVE